MLRRALLLGSTFFYSLTILAAHATAVSIPSISLPDAPSLFRRDPDPTKNSFTTPAPFGLPNDFSNNTVYPLGTLLEVLWISEWPAVDIALCQPTKGTSVGCELLLPNIQGKGYPLTVKNDTSKMYGFQDEIWSPDIYFLQLTPTNTQNPYIRSHYFNITKGAGDSDGGTSNSSSSTPASSSAASITQIPTATGTALSSSTTTTPTTAANATGFDALSLGAKLGIYIGAAAVTSAILGAAIFWLISRQRRRRRNENLAKVSIVESTSTLTSPVPLQEMDSESYVHETGEALPHEISSKEIPIEMPAEIPGLAISTYDDEDAGWDWRHEEQNRARSRGEDR